MRRSIVMVAIAASAFFAAPAAAQYGDAFTATVSDDAVVAGASIVVDGTCTAADSVEVAFGTQGVIGSGPVDANDLYSISVTIPQVAAGSYTLSTTCGSQVLRSTVVVGGGTAPTGTGTSPGDPSLPRTGDDRTGPLLRWGGALVLAGGAALLLTRRLKTTA